MRIFVKKIFNHFFAKKLKKAIDKSNQLCYNDQVVGEDDDLGVAQLGERYLGVVEAASSSLVT